MALPHPKLAAFYRLKDATHVQKTLTTLAIAAAALSVHAQEVLKVAATAVPHAEILNFLTSSPT